MEIILCPYCKSGQYTYWSEERGFKAVRCRSCSLIYVNPRPNLASISEAVKTGTHNADAHNLNVKARRSNVKVAHYRTIFARLFNDVWQRTQPISWLDVGAGYGEIIEALSSLAEKGSKIEGLEPMKHKAEQAKMRGLAVKEDYLRLTHPKVDFISLVDVFSHIPDFHEFLNLVKSVLKDRGEIFVETGNLADLSDRNDFPGELGLPDHLVFAGEHHLCGYLEKAGFKIVRIEKNRIDDIGNFVKNCVKKAIGRPSSIRFPYTSGYRSLLVRARLTSDHGNDKN
jgi:SAM-dependent methyltransferase